MPRSPDAGGAVQPLLALVGVTAAGKTELALDVARRAGAAVLSMDSMLVYRGMDVGTAKPSPAERGGIPHHLIDLVDPSERYDVQRYLSDHGRVERDLADRAVRGFTVGGTGYYLQALVRGLTAGPPVDLELRTKLQARAAEEGSAALHAELASVDPLAAGRVHPNDEKRVLRGLEVWLQTGRRLSDWQLSNDWRTGEGRPRRLVGLALDEPLLSERIRQRTSKLLDAGWVEEARSVRATCGFGATAIQALGYREVLDLADGRATRAETEQSISLRTRQFARRQRTWLRRFPDIHFVEAESESAAEEVLSVFGW